LEILLCPTAIDWGNASDIAGVAIALFVAFAAWKIGRTTNELANAANRTNSQTAELNREAAEESHAMLVREGRLLMLNMFSELQMVHSTTRAMLERISPSFQQYEVDPAYRIHISELIDSLPTSVISASKSRAHLLDDQAASSVLQLEAGIQMTSFAARRARENHAGKPIRDFVFENFLPSLSKLYNLSGYLCWRCTEVIEVLDIDVVDKDNLMKMYASFANPSK